MSHYGPGSGGGGGGGPGGFQRGGGPPGRDQRGGRRGGRDDDRYGRGGGSSRRGGPPGGGFPGGRGDHFRRAAGRGRGERGGRGGGRGGGRMNPEEKRRIAEHLRGIQTALTNIQIAVPSVNFAFFMYTVDIQDKDGQPIDSRGRRGALFRMAIFENLLRDMDREDKKNLDQVIFFQGSFFFSAKKVPGLDQEDLPRIFLQGYSAANGDTFRVVRMFHFLAPNEFEVAPSQVAGEHMVQLDRRCNGCNKEFEDVLSLLNHCRSTGHSPVYDPRDEGAVPAEPGVFIAYANEVLGRALEQKYVKWGREYMNTNEKTEPTDRRGQSLGVIVYQAYSCEFNFTRPLKDKAGRSLMGLTIDLRAKVIRNESLLQTIYPKIGQGIPQLSPEAKARLKQDWEGTIVVYKIDYKCYDVVGLDFEHSANTLPVEGLLVPDDRGGERLMTHAEYFQQRKNITLAYPDAVPMVVVRGKRRNTGNIFLPAELVCGNELSDAVREQLPMICNFPPDVRNRAIEGVKLYLDPYATEEKQNKKRRSASSLLVACGINLRATRISANATVMSIPELIAMGVPVPPGRENWAPVVDKAKFNMVDRRVAMNVVVFYNDTLDLRGVQEVYQKIQDRVNQFNAPYEFAGRPVEFVKTAGTDNPDKHHQDVSTRLAIGSELSKMENIFVLDFCLPLGKKEDPAYPVIKQILASGGHLSQFVSFRTFRHDRRPRDERDRKKGDMILQGVARQILQKAGVRLWWVKLPKELPLPAVFVGVDIFHAPKEYIPEFGRRVAKKSCAAIIVEVIRPGSENRHRVEIYSETFAREAGQEYELHDSLERAVRNALNLLKVNPASCIVWRDGIGEGAFRDLANQEIAGIRSGLCGTRQLPPAPVASLAKSSTPLSTNVPMAYVVCQKQIKTKFLYKATTKKEGGENKDKDKPDEPEYKDGQFACPPGTLVDGIQGLKHYTFYIQGRAPPNSTPKPVRYIVVNQDEELRDLKMPELTWALTHNYPNWTGSIKVPSVTMMAHKLAELAGGMRDSGSTIDHKTMANRIHFL